MDSEYDMGKTQHSHSRRRYESSPESALDQHLYRAREARRIRQKRKTETPSFGVLPWSQWEQDCINWRGMLLEGRYAHWCAAWDNLPMDETCPEWPCGCTIVQEVDGK